MSEAETKKDKMINAIADFIQEENCEAIRIPLWSNIFAVVGTEENIRKVLEFGK